MISKFLRSIISLGELISRKVNRFDRNEFTNRRFLLMLADLGAIIRRPSGFEDEIAGTTV